MEQVTFLDQGASPVRWLTVDIKLAISVASSHQIPGADGRQRATRSLAANVPQCQVSETTVIRHPNVTGRNQSVWIVAKVHCKPIATTYCDFEYQESA